MTELSMEVITKAHKLQAAVLRMLADKSQHEVALLLGMDDATVSRWKSDECGLMRAALMIAACGGKVVAEDAVVVNAEEYRLMCRISAEYFASRSER